jgi:hypothetical protein
VRPPFGTDFAAFAEAAGTAILAPPVVDGKAELAVWAGSEFARQRQSGDERALGIARPRGLPVPAGRDQPANFDHPRCAQLSLRPETAGYWSVPCRTPESQSSPIRVTRRTSKNQSFLTAQSEISRLDLRRLVKPKTQTWEREYDPQHASSEFDDRHALLALATALPAQAQVSQEQEQPTGTAASSEQQARPQRSPDEEGATSRTT